MLERKRTLNKKKINFVSQDSLAMLNTGEVTLDKRASIESRVLENEEILTAKSEFALAKAQKTLRLLTRRETAEYRKSMKKQRTLMN